MQKNYFVIFLNKWYKTFSMAISSNVALKLFIFAVIIFNDLVKVDAND